MSTRTVRILCVDDHAFVADGLGSRLAREPDFECIGRLASAEGLVAHVERQHPDIVVLDIEMPGPDPFEVADDIRRRFPSTRVVFLSAHVRDHYLSAAFKAGAWGYFSKGDDSEAIVGGLRKVAAGEFALGPKVAPRVRPSARQGRTGAPVGVDSESRLDSLTQREKEVLRLIGRGMSRTQIAKALCRSAKTVDGHRERIMNKLDIRSGAGLVRFAISEGLAET